MDAIAIPVAVALAALIVAPVAYAAFRLRRIDRVRLFDVVQGQHLAQPDAQSEASIRAGALATRRCVNCSAQPACDQAIAQRDWNALAKICPNDKYIEGLRRC